MSIIKVLKIAIIFSKTLLLMQYLIYQWRLFIVFAPILYHLLVFMSKCIYFLNSSQILDISEPCSPYQELKFSDIEFQTFLQVVIMQNRSHVIQGRGQGVVIFKAKKERPCLCKVRIFGLSPETDMFKLHWFQASFAQVNEDNGLCLAVYTYVHVNNLSNVY